MLEPPHRNDRHRRRQDREAFSMQMGALYWLAQRYETLPGHDPQVIEIINDVLHSEPRVIAADVRRFHTRYLHDHQSWP
jgi:hypothetical protein